MTKTVFQTQKIFCALGTVNTLTVYDGESYRALERAKSRVMQLHRLLNAFDERSEVSAINAAAGRSYVKVSPDTLHLVEASVRYSRLTGGHFDITAGPSAQLWKRAIAAKQTPLAYEVKQAVLLTDSRDILIDRARSAVMLRRTGQKLDFGAIAKGYAADEVRRIFREEGVTQAIINLGGTVINLGQVRRIGIQDPFKRAGRYFARVDVTERAVVSSGVYEQGFSHNGVRYHHIIDPKTGYPSQNRLAGVTLFGDSAEMLDALSTAAMVMPLTDTVDLLKARGIEAIFVTLDGDVFTTDGLNRLDMAG